MSDNQENDKVETEVVRTEEQVKGDLNELLFQKQVQEEAEKLGLVKKEEVKDDSASSKTETTEPQYSEIEQEAIEMGWDPAHKGENFVDAKEFVRVGQIMEAKRKATKRAVAAEEKIDGLQKAVNQLLEHNKKVEQIAYQKAIKEIQDRKDAAIMEGDVSGVRAAEIEAEALKNSQPVVQPQQQQYTQEQLDFANRNKDWFNPNNQDLVDTVSVTYDFLKAQDIKQGVNRPEVELLKEVEDTVKAIPRFAKKFVKTGVEKAKEAKVSLVETPSQSVTKQSVTLSMDDRIQLKQIQLADPSFSEKDFVKLKGQLTK